MFVVMTVCSLNVVVRFRRPIRRAHTQGGAASLASAFASAFECDNLKPWVVAHESGNRQRAWLAHPPAGRAGPGAKRPGAGPAPVEEDPSLARVSGGHGQAAAA